MKRDYRKRLHHKLLWRKLRVYLLPVLFFFLAGWVAFLQWREYGGKTGGNSSAKFEIPQSEELSRSLCLTEPEEIPAYRGEAYAELCGNRPGFCTYDIEYYQGEVYSPLDELGRCGTAVALLDRGMRPTGEREDIGMIKPSGWAQQKYPGIIDSEPPYLYNRCHLIAYAMTGQNANECNLITGTRYLNAESMLYWEKKVLQYLDTSENHVLYRVTPYFMGEELVARGVEMEAYSVEDQGRGICFHVFVYNVQPGVEIDYATGESGAEEN